MIIKAEEARKTAEKNMNEKRTSDITKTATIMKNIKARAEKGFYYYDYQASVNYAIAKTLIENGYKLRKFKHGNTILSLKNFVDTDFHNVRVEWKQDED